MVVLIIEALGVLVAICLVIGFFFIREGRRKALYAACALVVLAGFGAAAVGTRNGTPIINHAAPISAATQVIFAGSNVAGQIAIESLSARDGTLRWRHLLNFKQQDFLPQPIVSGNTTYVVASNDSHTALVLYALRSLNGDILWSHTLGFSAQDVVWDGAGPLLMDGKVYIAVGHGISLDSTANGISTLYALRADNGVTVWSRQLKGVDYQPGEGGPDPTVLAADGGRVFVNETDGHIHALRASDGAEIWSAGGGVGTIGIGSGVLYQRGFLGNLSIIALRESDGAGIWVHPFVSVHGMSAEGNRLVAVTMSSSVPGSLENLTAYLTGMNADDGKVLWQYPIGNTAPMPVVSNGAVYFADGFTLDALDIGDGHVLWHEHVPDRTNSEFDGVAVSPQGNVVFVTTSAYIGENFFIDAATCFCLPPDKVYALNVHDGSADWEYALPFNFSVAGSPQLAVN
jgi:outer membrane protein assembly factor BamB